MKRVIKLFESGLAVGILAVLFIVLVAAFIDIAYEIYQNILAPPILIVDASGLMSLFSLVLVLLIGLELTETVKAYLDDDVVHVDLVVLVAIIAIARKVIVWDIEKYSYIDLFSLAAMTLALGVTYFLIKRAEASSGEQGTRGNPKQALSRGTRANSSNHSRGQTGGVGRSDAHHTMHVMPERHTQFYEKGYSSA